MHALAKRRRAPIFVALLLALLACGPKAAVDPATGAPRPGSGDPAACAEAPWPETPVTAPPSGLVAHVELPFAKVRSEIEGKVPKRLAEEKDRDIGSAGRLQYTVDRRPFELSVKGDAILIEAPIVANAEACTSKGCYASCNPEGRFQVAVKLGADYKLHASDARVSVTKKCEVRMMGGLVRVDVTPTLRTEIAKRMPALQAKIERDLPSFKADAVRAWAELSKPRPVPLGKCLFVGPDALTQGPLAPIPDGARFRFLIAAHPELRVSCENGPASVPLPSLQNDRAMGTTGDVNLAIVEPSSIPCPTSPPPPAALAAALPALAEGASNERASVSAVIDGSKVGPSGIRGADRIAVVTVTGAATIRAK